MSTLSTLKVNRVMARGTSSEVRFDHDINLNANEIKNAQKITTNELLAPAATTLTAGLMSATDKIKLDAIPTGADQTNATSVEAAGAVMDSDFGASTVGVMVRAGQDPSTGEPLYALETDYLKGSNLSGSTGYIKVDAAGAFSVENATFLQANQTITIDGDATGSGNTNITLNLTESAIVGLPQFSAIDEDNDRVMIAIKTGVKMNGDPEYTLSQVTPKVLGVSTSGGGGTVSAFSGNMGISREPGETGNTVTLELNQLAINKQNLIYGDSTTNPQISGSDEILIGRSNVGLLGKITANHFGQWISTVFGTGSGGTGTTSVFGLAIKFEIDGNGNLTLIHTGGLTSNEMYINANSELLAVVV